MQVAPVHRTPASMRRAPARWRENLPLRQRAPAIVHKAPATAHTASVVQRTSIYDDVILCTTMYDDISLYTTIPPCTTLYHYTILYTSLHFYYYESLLAFKLQLFILQSQLHSWKCNFWDSTKLWSSKLSKSTLFNSKLSSPKEVQLQSFKKNESFKPTKSEAPSFQTSIFHKVQVVKLQSCKL